MDDLFKREQRILDRALKYLHAVQAGAPCDREEYEALAREYGKLLRQLRRITKISDKTAVNLNTSKLDLIDKVYFDALTGIYNRRYMEERLAEMLKTLSRVPGGLLSVLLMDIDYFKKYNDMYGHSLGDYCLKTVAAAISGSITRTDDFAARYGGEEFVIILPNTDEKGARLLAERVLENVRACGIPHEKSEAADHVTLSIGITTGAVSCPHCAEAYINKADEALYLSKENGRNRCTFLGFSARQLSQA